MEIILTCARAGLDTSPNSKKQDSHRDFFVIHKLYVANAARRKVSTNQAPEIKIAPPWGNRIPLLMRSS
ncbi:hypothetical protein [Myxococcus vastator]|uniref:hypothetical protein n=1 Tax=Myxococcus vastator TaxID=2709664 RepID=UPI0013D77FC9|nr:hypothetical protein [Myxococcus vastator]